MLVQVENEAQLAFLFGVRLGLEGNIAVGRFGKVLNIGAYGSLAKASSGSRKGTCVLPTARWARTRSSASCPVGSSASRRPVAAGSTFLAHRIRVPRDRQSGCGTGSCSESSTDMTPRSRIPSISATSHEAAHARSVPASVTGSPSHSFSQTPVLQRQPANEDPDSSPSAAGRGRGRAQLPSTA